MRTRKKYNYQRYVYPKPKVPLHTRIANNSARIITVLIIVLVVTVIISCVVKHYCSTVVTVRREFPRIVRDYYENYYYPNLVGTAKTDEYAEIFARYDKSGNGLPEVKLRQLLAYNGGKYSKYAPVFERAGCNTNRTAVTYRPIEPYGRQDYEIKYDLVCVDEIGEL